MRVIAKINIYQIILAISVLSFAILIWFARARGFPSNSESMWDSIIIEAGSFIITVALIGSASAWVQNHLEKRKRKALESYAYRRLATELDDVYRRMAVLAGLATPEPAILSTDIVKLDGKLLYYRPLEMSRLRIAQRDLEQQIRDLRTLIGEVGFVVPIEDRDHLFAMAHELARLPRHVIWLIETHADHFLDDRPLPADAPPMPQWDRLNDHFTAIMGSSGAIHLQRNGDTAFDYDGWRMMLQVLSNETAKAYLRTAESIFLADRHETIIARLERYEIAFNSGRMPNYLKAQLP